MWFLVNGRVYFETLMFLALVYILNIMWSHYKVRKVKFFRNLYLILILKKSNIPTSYKYFTTLFWGNDLNWKLINLLHRFMSESTGLRAFHCKTLQGVKYYNISRCYFLMKIFFRFKYHFSLCSFCNFQKENVIRLFSKCNKVNSLWTEITHFFGTDMFNSTDCLFGLLK